MNAIKRPETVLIVDDEESIRFMVRTILNRHGYRAIEARSGDEALEIWSAQCDEIDVVFTDLQMPGMSGDELVEKLLRMKPDLKVIFTSGSGISAVESMLNSQGGEHPFVPKPYKPETLVATVRETLM